MTIDLSPKAARWLALCVRNQIERMQAEYSLVSDDEFWKLDNDIGSLTVILELLEQPARTP